MSEGEWNLDTWIPACLCCQTGSEIRDHKETWWYNKDSWRKGNFYEKLLDLFKYIEAQHKEWRDMIAGRGVDFPTKIKKSLINWFFEEILIIDEVMWRRANFETKFTETNISQDHGENGVLCNKEFGRKGSSARKKAAGEERCKTRPSKQCKSLIVNADLCFSVLIWYRAEQ